MKSLKYQLNNQLFGKKKPLISLLMLAPVAHQIKKDALNFELELVGIHPQIEDSPNYNSFRASQEKIVRRLNIGISFCSGKWVVIAKNKFVINNYLLSAIEEKIKLNIDDAVIIYRINGFDCFYAIRRQTFAYGSFIERKNTLESAISQWINNLLSPKIYLHDNCNKIVLIDVDKNTNHVLGEITAKNEKINTKNARGKYQPLIYWEDGTDEYVKWEVYQPDENEIEAILELLKPSSVLELGCGAGRNIRYFKNAKSYVGIDLSANLLKRAIDRTSENLYGFVRGDITKLPFKSNKFEMIFSDSTLQHIPHEKFEECARELLRVSSKYIFIIEFTEEIKEGFGWFSDIHMFKHDYLKYFSNHSRLVLSGSPLLQIQPAIKMFYVFEKILKD